MARKLKFRIIDQINLLPRGVTLSDIETALEKLGITPSTFYRDRNIEASSDQSISVDRLLTYARYFKCALQDLLNEDHSKQPISVRKRKSKIKNGLE